MKNVRLIAAAAALLLPCAVLAHDHDRDRGDPPRMVDEHRPLKPDASVSVSNVAGLIDVESWDKNELSLTGELSEEVESLEITGSPSDLSIKVKLTRNTNDVGDTRLRLKVPTGTRLDADSVSADIRVRGLGGALKVRSVSGDLQLRVGSGKVDAQSVSGRIQLEAPSANTRIETVSGDIKVTGPKGEFHGETVSGDLAVKAADVARFSAETVSGDLHLELDLGKDADVNVETLSGEVNLSVPALPDGRIEMETFSGELVSEWGKVEEDAKEWRRDGNGKGRVYLHSFSGDIQLRKR